MIKEIWKPLFDWYEISNLGKIRRKSYEIRTAKTNGWKSKGYLKLCLTENGKSRSFLVHQLVAKTFLNRPIGRLVVNHINGDKSDNSVSNLEYVTYKENTRKYYDLKLKRTNSKLIGNGQTI